MKENNMSMEPLKPYLVKMRKYLKSIRVTKSMPLKQFVKYYYLVYYKIPRSI